MPNKMIVGIDSHVAEVTIAGKNEWQGVKFKSTDFKNAETTPLGNWGECKELRFDDQEILKAGKNSDAKTRKLGGQWQGKPPEFRYLQWLK